MTDDIVARLRERLARASIGDRMYERPMDWAEADTLLAEIERLRAALQRIVDYGLVSSADLERALAVLEGEKKDD
jgi:hypothetical protein